MRICYSCVVDQGERFSWQCRLWVWSLTRLGKIAKDSLCVHLVGENPSLEAFLAAEGVKYLRVEAFGDGLYCNKLAQCESPLLQEADFIFLTDCDMAFLSSLDGCVTQDACVGKIVDMPNPPLQLLRKVFSHYRVVEPPLAETLTEKSFANNFNGGLYGIPRKYFAVLGSFWKRFASDLLSSEEMRQTLGHFSKHIDQIAFCLAVNVAQIPTIALPLAYNFPLHIMKKVLEAKAGCVSPLSQDTVAKTDFSVLCLHYHSCTENGLLQYTGNVSLDEKIAIVNALINEESALRQDV